MKHLFSLTLLSFFFNAILTAQPTIEWQKCFGGSFIERAYSVLQTSKGGYVVAGLATSTDGEVVGLHGNQDLWVLKLDNQGNALEKKIYGGTKDEVPGTLIETSDGGFIIACYSFSNDGDLVGAQGYVNAWIVKLDTNLDMEWSKIYGSGFERAYSITHAADGGYVFLGIAPPIDTTKSLLQSDLWVVKLDQDGNMEWGKKL